MSERLNTYYMKHYGKLVGMTVINVQMQEGEEGGDPFPVLLMGRDNGTGGVVDGSHLRMTIAQDPEGNGAGFAFIEPMGF